MPDYAACKETKCKKKNTCARYRMEPDPCRQSYFMDMDPEECIHYWDIKEGVPFELKPDEGMNESV